MPNNKNITERPLILCGPIVRRVEPTQAAIWLALKSAAKVKLSVWKGKVEHKDINDSPKVGEVEKDTIAIGKHLHLVVVNLELEEGNLLDWGELYSYNISMTTTEDGTKDFKQLGLLDNLEGDTNGHSALSYQVGFLPTFMLAAKLVEDLKVLHGSCRNNATKYEDALSWVDDFIKKSWDDTALRPQQLFLSGDQVYADSVIGELLNELSQWGCTLLDEKETLLTDWVEPETGKNRWPADDTHFPSYIRRRLVDSEARFTSTDTANHLISFGEFASMYMSVWSDALWDVDLKNDEGDNIFQNFEDVFNKITSLPENYGAIFRRNLTDERANKTLSTTIDNNKVEIKFKDFFTDDIIKNSINFLLVIDPNNDLFLNDKKLLKTLLTNKGSEEDKNKAQAKLKAFLDNTTGNNQLERFKYQYFFDYFKSWIGGFYPAIKKTETAQTKEKKKKEEHLKLLHRTLPKVRRALANISTFMIFDDHEVTDDWNLNVSWRRRISTSLLGKSIVRNGLIAYALFQDWGNQPRQYQGESDLFELNKDLAGHLDGEALSDALKTAFEEKQVTLEQEKVSIKKLHKDEWQLENQTNKNVFLIRKYKEDEEEVLKVLKNPKAYFLKKISELFTTDDDTNQKENELDFLLGLDHHHQVVGNAGRWQLPDNRSPLIKWHYTYQGAKHKVLAIDNRTRRTFTSFAGAPGNLSFNGMKDLIPENPQVKDDEVLFVVAPLPVLGPSTLDELVAPLAFKVFDVKGALKNEEPIKSGMKGTNPDAIEAWVFDPVSQEELLKRLSGFKKVIILSGDVHYGSSQRLHYWKKGEDKPACFAQLTSSGMRNVMPSYIQYISKHFPVAQKLIRGNVRAERLGWHKNQPKPLKFKADTKVPIRLRYQLKSSPVIVSAQGWPAETTYAENREPDWSWRVHNVIDRRAENERPELTRINPVFTEESDDDKPKEGSMDSLRAIARRHSEQMKKVNFTRQILFKANIGLVTFELEEEGGEKTLQLLHNIYAAPFEGNINKPAPSQPYDLYAVHKIALEASAEDKAPEIRS